MSLKLYTIGGEMGSGIEDGPEVPEVQRQHNVQRTIRLRRVGAVTGHIIALEDESRTLTCFLRWLRVCFSPCLISY